MQNKNDLQHYTDNTVVQWLTFSLDNETYCVEVLQVREALRFIDIAPVPGSPDHVIGIINLRGQVITIHNLRRLLGLTDKEVTDQSRIILLEVSDQIQGILVDSVTEIVNIKTSDIENATTHGDDSPFIKGTFQHQGNLLILLSVDELLMGHSTEEY